MIRAEPQSGFRAKADAFRPLQGGKWASPHVKKEGCDFSHGSTEVGGMRRGGQGGLQS